MLRLIHIIAGNRITYNKVNIKHNENIMANTMRELWREMWPAKCGPRTILCSPLIWILVGLLECGDWPEAKILPIRGCIRKSPDWVDNEIKSYNNKHSLRSNTKGYGGKTNWTDSQNSDTAAPSSRELYHLQFSLQVTSPETFGHTLVK
jgi:hypothetical protein